MLVKTIQMIVFNPLLWWLLSVTVIFWGVFKAPDQSDLKWFDRPLILILWALGAFIVGDWYITLKGLDVSFDQIFSVQKVVEGEKGSIGAILGSVFALLIYFRIRKIPILVNADKIVPYIALMYAIARIGCFFNGDDFGTVSNLPWAVSFGPSTEAYHAHLSRGWIGSGDVESLRVHPSQLYHATAGLMGFFLLKSWRGNWQGSRFALAWVYYGATRFGIEFFRDEHEVNAAIIDPAQWFSLLFIVAGLLIWFRYRHYSRREMLVTG